MMKALSRLTLTAAVLLASPAFAVEAQPEGVVQSAAPLETPVSKPLPKLGLTLGAGVPDGATGSLTYRPFSWVHAEVGMSYNLISKGVRAGVSLVPFGAGPSATLEARAFTTARSSSASATTTSTRTWASTSACAGSCSSFTAA